MENAGISPWGPQLDSSCRSSTDPKSSGPKKDLSVPQTLSGQPSSLPVPCWEGFDGLCSPDHSQTLGVQKFLQDFFIHKQSAEAHQKPGTISPSAPAPVRRHYNPPPQHKQS